MVKKTTTIKGYRKKQDGEKIEYFSQKGKRLSKKYGQRIFNRLQREPWISIKKARGHAEKNYYDISVYGFDKNEETRTTVKLELNIYSIEAENEEELEARKSYFQEFLISKMGQGDMFYSDYYHKIREFNIGFIEKHEKQDRESYYEAAVLSLRTRQEIRSEKGSLSEIEDWCEEYAKRS